MSPRSTPYWHRRRFILFQPNNLQILITGWIVATFIVIAYLLVRSLCECAREAPKALKLGDVPAVCEPVEPPAREWE